MNWKTRVLFLLSLIILTACQSSFQAQVPASADASPAGLVNQTEEITSEPVPKSPDEPISQNIGSLMEEKDFESHDTKQQTTDTVQNDQILGRDLYGETLELLFPQLTYPGAYNGPLYATSEQIGEGYPIDKYMSNLDRNGVNWFIGFFTFLPKPEEGRLMTDGGLGYLITSVQKYPGRIIPFYNPGLGGKEAEPLVGSKLSAIYKDNLDATVQIAGSDLIQGLGEIETQEWGVAHNSPQVKQLFDLARQNSMNAMYHPVASKITQVDALAKEYSQTQFIIHMYRSDVDKSREDLIRILKENDNIYFSIDAAHIIHLNNQDILYDLKTSNEFISKFDANYNYMLNDAVSDYKSMVEAVPTKIMWGTEAGPEYSFEPQVYDRVIKISRAFIGKMPLESQEAIGYKNALRVFGQGITLNQQVTVIDASSWKPCTQFQLAECDSQCGIDDLQAETLTSGQESCFEKCLLIYECIDPLA